MGLSVLFVVELARWLTDTHGFAVFIRLCKPAHEKLSISLVIEIMMLEIRHYLLYRVLSN